jgi:tRNA(Ile)-lysidine synthetase-like protein
MREQLPVHEFVLQPKAARLQWGGGSLLLRYRASRPSAPVAKKFRRGEKTLFLSARRLHPGVRLQLRAARAGDRFTPSGRRRPLSLARFLAKQGVPQDERAFVPLLLHDGEVAAACGIRGAAGYVTNEGGRVLEVIWKPRTVLRPRAAADE